MKVKKLLDILQQNDPDSEISISVTKNVWGSIEGEIVDIRIVDVELGKVELKVVVGKNS